MMRLLDDDAGTGCETLFRACDSSRPLRHCVGYSVPHHTSILLSELYVHGAGKA